MDNLSSHRSTGGRERIEAVGASLLIQRPTPYLNPIENAWAKLKQQLRAVKARKATALDQAIAELLPTIRPGRAGMDQTSTPPAIPIDNQL